MKIENLMTRAVKTCRPDDTLARAAQIFWDQDCGVAPVVDAENRVVGMLTDRDVCMAGWMSGRPLAELRVVDSMTDRVYSCRSDDTPARALSMLRARHVRRLPVLDEEGRLVGIVSLNDLVRHAAKERASVSPQEIVTTFAAVCEPHARERSAAPTSAVAAPSPRAVTVSTETVFAASRRG